MAATTHGADNHGHGGHGHDAAEGAPPYVPMEGVTPRPYWETTPSRRARPQFDPREVARAYLDDMERGGRLHGQRKRA